jgi:hypothetical protein
MRKLALAVTAIAAFTVAFVATANAEAAVRRVYGAGVRPRAHFVTPIRRVYRPLIFVPQTTPVIYSPWNYNSTIVVPHGNHLHVVPTNRPVGVWAPVVW